MAVDANVADLETAFREELKTGQRNPARAISPWL